MSLIISTVKKEKQRIDYMLEKYREMLAGLPKGTISEKKIPKIRRKQITENSFTDMNVIPGLLMQSLFCPNSSIPV